MRSWRDWEREKCWEQQERWEAEGSEDGFRAVEHLSPLTGPQPWAGITHLLLGCPVPLAKASSAPPVQGQAGEAG